MSKLKLGIICTAAGILLGILGTMLVDHLLAVEIDTGYPEYVSVTPQLGRVFGLEKRRIPHNVIRNRDLYKQTRGYDIETFSTIVLETVPVEVTVPVYVTEPAEGLYSLNFDTADLPDDTLGISGKILLDHYDVREATFITAELYKEPELTTIELVKVSTDEGYVWHIAHDNPNIVIRDFSVVEVESQVTQWTLFIGALLDSQHQVGVSLGINYRELFSIFNAPIGLYGKTGYYFAGEAVIEAGISVSF